VALYKSNHVTIKIEHENRREKTGDLAPRCGEHGTSGTDIDFP
jgi:hypothetical protein